MIQSDLNVSVVAIILMLSIIVIQAKNAPIQTTGVVPEERRITRNLDLTLTDEEHSVDEASSSTKLLPRSSRKIDKPHHGINRFLTHRDHSQQDKILVVTDKVKEIASPVLEETKDDELMLNWMGSSTYEKMPFFQENGDEALTAVTDKVEEVASQPALPSGSKDDELMLNWMGSSTYEKMPFFQENKNGDEALAAVTDKVEEVALPLASPSALPSETKWDELMLNWMGSSSYAEWPYFQDDDTHESKVRKFKTPNKLGSWVKS